jgi:hypothetical protein
MSSPEIENQVQVETSNPETQTQTSIEPQKLTPELIRNLVEKAEKEGREETRFLLKISTWRRQGESYEDYATYDVIYGNAEIVVLKDWDEGYPYRKGSDLLVMPKTVPVVVIWRNKFDYGTESGEIEKVYVFTSDGWKEVKVK